MGLFDIFKDKDEDSDNEGMVEESVSEDTSSSFESEPEPEETIESVDETPSTESAEETPSSSQLLKSTIIALAVAGALLLCVVIPAEYGKDPTGVGELLGLKKMGEIKIRLEKESLNENQVFNENISLKDEVREGTETSEENHDVLEFTLEPDEAIEIKLEMIEGSLVSITG